MLVTLPDFSSPEIQNSIKKSWTVAPVSLALQSPNLLGGTERYASEWINRWHRERVSTPLDEVLCLILRDALVSGAGHIWVKDRLLSCRQIMPDYVANLLELNSGGSHSLRQSREHPIRIVDEPCLIALGHGSQVYGHFLIEVMFRLLVARAAGELDLPKHRVLIDRNSPSWYIYLLTQYFGYDLTDIEFIEPESECVHLRNAIVSTLVHQSYGFHPVANDMLDDLKASVGVCTSADMPPRIFLARRNFKNPHAPERICVNEEELIHIAQTKHGFAPVSTETMDWQDQIKLFSHAKIVVGQAGSGMHNALFCAPGSRVGSIGFMNQVQTNIAALRSQSISYLTEGFHLSGEFRVDKSLFEEFLDQTCMG